MMSIRTRALSQSISLIAFAVVLLIFLGLMTSASQERPTHRPGADADQDARPGAILLGDGAGRLPAQSARDWVTYADHVVSVTVASEVDLPPSIEEMERGEGLIFRSLSLSVNDVLWSAKAADHAAPKSLEWVAFGWQFTEGSISNRVEMGVRDTSRLEVGHSYVIAIDWVSSDCESPGSWDGLSGDGVLAFDQGTVGVGEFEGREMGLSEAQELAQSSNSLRRQLAGKHRAAVVAYLHAAQPRSTARTDESGCADG